MLTMRIYTLEGLAYARPITTLLLLLFVSSLLMTCHLNSNHRFMTSQAAVYKSVYCMLPWQRRKDERDEL